MNGESKNFRRYLWRAYDPAGLRELSSSLPSLVRKMPQILGFLSPVTPVLTQDSVIRWVPYSGLNVPATFVGMSDDDFHVAIGTLYHAAATLNASHKANLGKGAFSRQRTLLLYALDDFRNLDMRSVAAVGPSPATGLILPALWLASYPNSGARVMSRLPLLVEEWSRVLQSAPLPAPSSSSALSFKG